MRFGVRVWFNKKSGIVDNINWIGYYSLECVTKVHLNG